MTVADALGLCSPQLPPGMLSLLLSGEREPGQMWGGFHGPRGPGEPTAKTRALSASAAGHGTAARVGARRLAGFPGPGRWQRLKRDSHIAKNLVSTHASGDTDGPCSKGHPSIPHRLGLQQTPQAAADWTDAGRSKCWGQRPRGQSRALRRLQGTICPRPLSPPVEAASSLLCPNVLSCRTAVIGLGRLTPRDLILTNSGVRTLFPNEATCWVQLPPWSKSH